MQVIMKSVLLMVFLGGLAILIILFFKTDVDNRITYLETLRRIDALQYSYGGIEPFSGIMMKTGSFSSQHFKDFGGVEVQNSGESFIWASWRKQKLIPYQSIIKRDNFRDVFVTVFVSEDGDGFVLIEHGRIGDLQPHWGVRTTYDLFCRDNITPVSKYYEYRFYPDAILWAFGEVRTVYPSNLRENFCNNSFYTLYGYHQSFHEDYIKKDR